MYKVKYNLCPSYIADIFNLSNRSFNLRNSGNFMIPRINTTTYGEHCISYIGPVKSGAPNEKIVQKHLNIALLKVF